MLQIGATCTADLTRLAWHDISLQITCSMQLDLNGPCTGTQARTMTQNCTCHSVGHNKLESYRQKVMQV